MFVLFGDVFGFVFVLAVIWYFFPVLKSVREDMIKMRDFK